MSKIKELWLKYKEYILYLVFGGLTTLVNYIVYFALTRLVFAGQIDPATGDSFGWVPIVANAISWVAAVAFAYITNRIWVFESKNKGSGAVLKEIGEFVAGRLITLGLEELILFIFVTLLHFNDIIIKIIASIITILLNYIFSKFIIFKKKKDSNTQETGSSDEKD